MVGDTRLGLKDVLKDAVHCQKAGQRDEAEALYRRALQIEPGHPMANHNLGVLAVQRGQMIQGLGHLKAALDADQAVEQYWLSYARALIASHRRHEALVILEQARERGFFGPALTALLLQLRGGKNSSATDTYQLAVQHHRANRLAEAAALYRKVVALEPDHSAAYCNLGAISAAQGNFEEAVGILQAAAGARPHDSEIQFNLGNALTAMGRLDEAVAAYDRALTEKPDFAEAHFRLGSLLSEAGHVAEGFDHFMRRACLVHKTPMAPQAGNEPLHKVKHDREQREYLADRILGFSAASDDRIFHLEDGSRLSGPAINPAIATPAVMQKWKSDWPQFVVLDDFLTPEALVKLRNYCAGSTIWRRIYTAGYIGATPEDGLACPLMAQIAEEVRVLFPEILSAHLFRYLGAFKYDSTLSTGTNIHADNSAVNLNLYITPDEANLDPESGGMDIWDVSMPLDIDMRVYNGDEAAAQEFLRRSRARATTIPHRANRAVLFKSDLFHKTSDCKFKEGYLNKRINVSLLFGNRGDPTSENRVNRQVSTG